MTIAYISLPATLRYVPEQDSDSWRYYDRHKLGFEVAELYRVVSSVLLKRTSSLAILRIQI